MEVINTIVLVVIALWAFALAFSTARMIFNIKRYINKARTSDWIQLATMVAICGLAGGILFRIPSLLATYTSGLIGVEIGLVVLLQHISERQYHSIKRLKDRFQRTC